MSWKSPNTIIGPAAEGKKYFSRRDIEEKIWRKILSNHNILFLAPRRVGKSSIVIEMAKNPKEGFVCKYENIQSDSSLEEFYKRMCKMIYNALTPYKKTTNSIGNWFKKRRISEIGMETISLSEVEVSSRSEFYQMLRDLKEHDIKVVLFLDEFPDVVWNIYKKQSAEEADMLLNDMRALRNNEDFKQVFIMVLLGSIGLNHIVKKITERTDKVNDLHKEYLKALKDEDINNFVQHLLVDATMQMDVTTTQYLLQKIGHYLPFYIQLIIEECDEILIEQNRPELTKYDIDLGYNRLLKKSEYFSDWDSRLSKYFPEKYLFLLEILKICSQNGKLSIQEVYNIAKNHNNENEWKADLDDILVADGYLFEDNNVYQFNSPLLRDWWKIRHPKMP